MRSFALTELPMRGKTLRQTRSTTGTSSILSKCATRRERKMQSFRFQMHHQLLTSPTSNTNMWWMNHLWLALKPLISGLMSNWLSRGKEILRSQSRTLAFLPLWSRSQKMMWRKRGKICGRR